MTWAQASNSEWERYRTTDPGLPEREDLFNSGNASDGVYPYGDLMLDVSGNLYGTTRYGGELFAVAQAAVLFSC
jgi:hypothetical protein